MLGDTEFNMLATWRHRPFVGGEDVLFGERVDRLLTVEYSAPVDPWTEIRRDCNVGGGGDDPGRKRAVRSRDVVEDATEAVLGGPCSARNRQLRGHLNSWGLMATGITGGEWYFVEECLKRPRVDIESSEAIPLVAFHDAHFGAEPIHLIPVHQTRVVVLVTRERQAETLGGIANEAGRYVVVDGVKYL